MHLLNRRSVGPPMDTTSDARHSTRCCGRLRRKRSASNFFRGFLARELRVDQGQIYGVSAQGEGDAKLNVEAKLVVGADGRNSRVAELTGLPGKEPPNGRIFYFAHYRNLPLVSGTRSQLWFLEPDVAYTHSAALARTGMAAKSGGFSTGRPFNFIELIATATQDYHRRRKPIQSWNYHLISNALERRPFFSTPASSTRRVPGSSPNAASKQIPSRSREIVF